MKKILLCVAMVYGSQHGAILRNGPLHHAAYEGDAAEVQKLLADGVGVHSLGSCCRTPLFAAARSGHVDIVKILLSAGAHLHAQDRAGQTASHQAVSGDHWHVLKEFFDRGVAVGIRDPHGNTLLHHAVARSSLVTAKNLLACGIDPHATNLDGESALHWVHYTTNKDFVELLLAHKVDVNIQNNSGDTVLHGLILYRLIGQERISRIQGLLCAGADLSIKNKAGKTAFDIALDLAKDPNCHDDFHILDLVCEQKTLRNMIILKAYRAYRQGQPKLLKKILSHKQGFLAPKVEQLLSPSRLAEIQQSFVVCSLFSKKLPVPATSTAVSALELISDDVRLVRAKSCCCIA